MRGLRGEVADLRHTELHPCGEFVTRDARRQFSLARIRLEMPRIHPLQKIPRRPIRLRRNTRRDQMAHGIFRAEGRPLKRRRKKSRPPIVRARLRDPTRIEDGNERGQILIFASERIAHPRPETGKAIEHKPGRKEILRRPVRVRFARERMHECDVVREFREMRDHIRHHLPGLPARAELILRSSQIAGRSLKRHRRPAH